MDVSSLFDHALSKPRSFFGDDGSTHSSLSPPITDALDMKPCTQGLSFDYKSSGELPMLSLDGLMHDACAWTKTEQPILSGTIPCRRSKGESLSEQSPDTQVTQANVAQPDMALMAVDSLGERGQRHQQQQQTHSGQKEATKESCWSDAANGHGVTTLVAGSDIVSSPSFAVAMELPSFVSNSNGSMFSTAEAQPCFDMGGMFGVSTSAVAPMGCLPVRKTEIPEEFIADERERQRLNYESKKAAGFRLAHKKELDMMIEARSQLIELRSRARQWTQRQNEIKPQLMQAMIEQKIDSVQLGDITLSVSVRPPTTRSINNKINLWACIARFFYFQQGMTQEQARLQTRLLMHWIFRSANMVSSVPSPKMTLSKQTSTPHVLAKRKRGTK